MCRKLTPKSVLGGAATMGACTLALALLCLTAVANALYIITSDTGNVAVAHGECTVPSRLHDAVVAKLLAREVRHGLAFAASDCSLPPLHLPGTCKDYRVVISAFGIPDPRCQRDFTPFAVSPCRLLARPCVPRPDVIPPFPLYLPDFTNSTRRWRKRARGSPSG